MHRALLIGSLLVFAATPADASAQSLSPYADQQDRTIKALSDNDMRDLVEGRGMGLAKAAELNSYPGPLHVLQFADELGLSESQRAATQGLYADMSNKAQTIGRKIIEAERNLNLAFVNNEIEPAGLRGQVVAIAALQGELRVVHLATHLSQRSLLTAEQIARYDVLRGYGHRVPHESGRNGSR